MPGRAAGSRGDSVVKRLTADQWESARAMREIGTSYEDVAKKFGVTRQAIMKRAKAEGWKDDEDVAAIVRRKTAEKVAGVVTVGDPQKKAAAIDAAADETAAVVRRHRQEWMQVVKLRQEALAIREHDHRESFERSKLAKITAEMTAIQQAGERKAWGLDDGAPTSPPLSRPLIAL